MRRSGNAYWREPLFEGVAIVVIVLGLFFYWYGVANRHIVFLYAHTAQNLPPAEPFDDVTSSRYWMAGLVAAGVVLVFYTPAKWLQGRIRRVQPVDPTPWWRVWVVCAIPISSGIPAITMTINTPVLPPALAAACVIATIAGLAIAIAAGAWAAERPRELCWLVADGVGLMPALLALRAVELPGRGLSISGATAWLMAIGGLAVGAVWLVGMSLLRQWRQPGNASSGAIFLAGLGLSYVLLPLAHYLVGTPPAYRYITTAGNFFAFSLGVQAFALIVAAGLAVGVVSGRRWLDRRFGS